MLAGLSELKKTIGSKFFFFCFEEQKIDKRPCDSPRDVMTPSCVSIVRGSTRKCELSWPRPYPSIHPLLSTYIPSIDVPPPRRMINLISPRETTSTLSCRKNRIISPGGDRYIARVAYRMYVNYDETHERFWKFLSPHSFFLLALN